MRGGVRGMLCDMCVAVCVVYSACSVFDGVCCVSCSYGMGCVCHGVFGVVCTRGAVYCDVCVSCVV